MHGFSVNKFQTAEHSRINQEIIQNYSDYSLYNVRIPGIDFHDYPGTVTKMSNSNSIPARFLEEALDSKIVFGFRKPAMWINGSIGARLHYITIFNALGGDVYLGIGIFGQKFGTITNPFSVQFSSFTPPLQMNRYENTDIYRYLTGTIAVGSISYDDDYVTVCVERNAKNVLDTYSQTIGLAEVELIYTEGTNRNVGFKYSPEKNNIKP